jgi:hypothetical protein
MLKMNESTNILVDIMSEQTATAAAKDRIDFEEAFALHHRTVFRAARSDVQDAGIAEDVTQETFLRFYKHRTRSPTVKCQETVKLIVTRSRNIRDTV